MVRPLKWHGGKHYLAKRIIELMPPHIHYVEPYFGGGAVLFAKLYDGTSEVVNDLDGDLINFWRVLQGDDTRDELLRILSFTPMALDEWKYSVAYFQAFSSNLNTELQDIPRAAEFFVRYRQSRQGLGKDFATLSRNRTRRGMNEQVSSWLSAIDGLPEAHERLKRVVILNADAVNVILQQDGMNTHFYIDPPYLHETRATTDAYQHEMNRDQHKQLLEVLGGINGTFQLSGYKSSLYEHYASEFGWKCVEFDLPNHSSGTKTKERKTECMWTNYFPE